MAKITNQICHFKTEAAYLSERDNIDMNTCVVLIKDTQKLITHDWTLYGKDVESLLVNYLKLTGGTITGGLTIKSGANRGVEINKDGTGEISAEGEISAYNFIANNNIHAYGSISVENGTSDDILLADGSTTSLAAINAAISSIPKFAIEVVSSLPSTPSTTTIYLIKNQVDGDTNLYTEYIYTNGKWEKLGTQEVDLSGYVKIIDNNLSSQFYADYGFIGLTKGGATSSIQLSAASSTAAGLMKASDKSKLDGIASGAEVNQNAYSKVVIAGSSSQTIQAGSKQDTITLNAGSNINISAGSGNNLTISSIDTNTSHAHTAGAGITLTGSGGTSGTTTIKAKMASEASLGTSGAANFIWPVGVDANGNLAIKINAVSSSVNGTLSGTDYADIMNAINDYFGFKGKISWYEGN